MRRLLSKHGEASEDLGLTSITEIRGLLEEGMDCSESMGREESTTYLRRGTTTAAVHSQTENRLLKKNDPDQIEDRESVLDSDARRVRLPGKQG
jgi:hypothetical protein